jgi:hypothetical protein
LNIGLIREAFDAFGEDGAGRGQGAGHGCVLAPKCIVIKR